MKVGDIIEVLNFENGDLENMRRIKLTEVRRRPNGGWRVAGVNMKGRHPIVYSLGRYPMSDPPHNGLAWANVGQPITIDE